MSRTITVKGYGKLSLAPDLCVVSLTLKALDPVYDKTMEKAAKQLASLQGALAGVGFDKKELKTSAFRVYTEQESRRDENGNYASVFVGYGCTQEIELSFGFDTGRLSQVLSAVTESVSDPGMNISFRVKDTEAAVGELLAAAVKDAKKKAQVLADAADVPLGKILQIEYGKAEHDFSSRTEYAMDRKCMAMNVGAAMSVTPENVELTENVTLVWEIG